MLEGCIGLSVGRDYDPGIWADFDEILACAKEAAKHNGIFSSHCLRTGHRKPRRPGEFPPVKTKGLLEAIEIARISKIPVQVSHLGIVYDIQPDDNKDLMMKALESTLKIIDKARAEGLEVDFDTIPHHLTGGIGTSPWLIHTLRPWLLVSGTPIQLAKALSMPDFREEIKENIWSGKHYRLNPNINPKWASTRVIVECNKKEYLEKTVAEIAKEKDKEELEALFDVIEADPYSKAIRKGDDDWVKLEFYKHPNMMIGVDTFAVDEKRQSSSDPPSYPNQNSYGGFPRFLRRVVKETNTLSIQEAVRKITRNPATKFRLINRGILKESYYADLVIWHPEIITDKGNQIEPRKYPEGIPYVMVNGLLVVDNSRHTENLPGKLLKRTVCK
jgi:N-acyl-D-aspartate/D-glutamate deacylase